MASAMPQPMLPESSFMCHMQRRMTFRAVPMSVSAMSATTRPNTMTARQPRSPPCGNRARSGPTASMPRTLAAPAGTLAASSGQAGGSSIFFRKSFAFRNRVMKKPPADGKYPGSASAPRSLSPNPPLRRQPEYAMIRTAPRPGRQDGERARAVWRYATNWRFRTTPCT